MALGLPLDFLATCAAANEARSFVLGLHVFLAACTAAHILLAPEDALRHFLAACAAANDQVASSIFL